MQPPPRAAQVGKGACVRGAARELGGGGHGGGAGGRSAVGPGPGQRRRPGGRPHFADLLHRPQATAQPPRHDHPHQAPAPRPPPGRLGAEPSGGAGIPPSSTPSPPLLGARFLPLPARPPPGRQPTACPRGRQEATCPRKECRAWRAGGGRWAGPGRGGRERPTGKVGESEGARPRPPGPPRRPCVQPVRGPARSRPITLSPPTRGRDDPRALGLQRGRSARLGLPPPPSARPRPSPAPGRGQAVLFPHTPLRRRRRLWGPGGEQGAD